MTVFSIGSISWTLRDRQIVRATELAPFGSHKFRIPFETANRKWVRFAVWDAAGDGASTQPVHLN
jgi:hypothetical protein